MFSNAEAYVLPAVKSDHSPILLSLFPDSMKKWKEFKFKEFWLEDEEYKAEAVWHDPNSRQEGLVENLGKS